MEVVHLSTRDSSGGAARAAYRLHQGLQEVDVDSSMFARYKDSQDETVEAWSPSSSLFGGIKTRIKRRWLAYRFQKYQATRPEGLEPFSQARTVHGNRIARAVPATDIYNLHWISGFIDPLPLFHFVEQPVVWTLHDMNPFTGGCHYTVGCRRFEESCGRCPQLGSEDAGDLSHQVWNRKQSAYRHILNTGHFRIVSPSKWLAEEARKSTLFCDDSIHIIPHGLDQSTFRPRDTEGMCTSLNIPGKHRIILFVAQSLQNHRKGFDLLAEALSALAVDDVTLLSIGGAEPELETGLPHVHLGRIESDLLLSVFYSLADLFVIPSRQEAFGQTALESMACGTPVVGFDTGGIPDMVRPRETGWLADTGNVRALRESIEQALDDERTRKRMGKQCRAVVEDEYTLEQQAQEYRSLYEDLLRT